MTFWMKDISEHLGILATRLRSSNTVTLDERSLHNVIQKNLEYRLLDGLKITYANYGC